MVTVPIQGRTRSNVALAEPDGTTTKVNEPGTPLNDAELTLVAQAVLGAAHVADWVVLSGSLPLDMPAEVYPSMCRAFAASGLRVAVDTSGPALQTALKAGPDLVKPNREELAEATGMRLTCLGDVIEAAEKMRASGARAVLASLGADGALLLQHDGWYGTAHAEPRSSVGAGDALLAGFLSAGAHGPEALAAGLAWGAAAVALPGSRMPGPEHIKHDTVTIRPPDPRHPCHRGAQRMTDTYTPSVTGTGAKATIQRIGGYLAGMIMPNIGAFIAWGLVTALFIPTGWLPNETLAKLVGPMISILLPVLIGYTGGRMVHGQRGAVVGAVATMGVVVGVTTPRAPPRCSSAR